MPSIPLATTQLRPALQLLNAVQGEIGLPLSASILSVDQSTVQLVYLMNALGSALAKFPLWPDLRTEWSITTTTDADYDLPVDWSVPLNGTTWDRSSQWPLIGPKTPTEWQLLKSGIGVAAPRYRFRFYGRQFHLHPAPVADLTIVQEYLSSNWVLGTNGSVANLGKPRISLDNDYILIDERLFIEGVKLSFLEAKGLDSSKAFRNFTDLLEAAWANTNAAPTLSLAPTSSSIFISEYNIPETGYGV